MSPDGLDLPPDLQRGAQVTWQSRSRGSITHKTGVVVAVVREDDDPRKCVPAGFRVMGGISRLRGHRSYLVQVGDSRTLHWPRIKDLRLATAAPGSKP